MLYAFGFLIAVIARGLARHIYARDWRKDCFDVTRHIGGRCQNCEAMQAHSREVRR